jgi:hypothetical protein
VPSRWSQLPRDIHSHHLAADRANAGGGVPADLHGDAVRPQHNGASRGAGTLSLLMFEFATASRFESAAVIGVLMALISLLTTSLVFKMGAKFGIEH